MLPFTPHAESIRSLQRSLGSSWTLGPPTCFPDGRLRTLRACVRAYFTHSGSRFTVSSQSSSPIVSLILARAPPLSSCLHVCLCLTHSCSLFVHLSHHSLLCSLHSPDLSVQLMRDLCVRLLPSPSCRPSPSHGGDLFINPSLSLSLSHTLGSHDPRARFSQWQVNPPSP